MKKFGILVCLCFIGIGNIYADENNVNLFMVKEGECYTDILFGIYDNDGNEVYRGKTDSQGMIGLSLSKGSYTLKQLSSLNDVEKMEDYVFLVEDGSIYRVFDFKKKDPTGVDTSNSVSTSGDVSISNGNNEIDNSIKEDTNSNTNITTSPPRVEVKEINKDYVPAYEGNYTKGRYGHKIKYITIHHMAGRLSSYDCGRIFQTPGRLGSSHYGIGYDGHISQYVSESDTAWTNSNWISNLESVTIEVSDNDNSWYVNDDTLNSLIILVADIARRNNLGILVKGENVTWHSMFTNTDCPGWYLLSKMDYIIDEANKINAGYTGYDYLYNSSSGITYQAYTNYWLPEVNRSDNSYNGYAGIYNEPITGFRCRSNSNELIYEAHGIGRGWYGAVSSNNYYANNGSSYAGIYGQAIDLIRIKSSGGNVSYRVKTLEDGWLPWVNKYSDNYDGYAGIKGHAIIGIQIK